MCGPEVMTDGIISQLGDAGVEERKSISLTKSASPDAIDPDTIEAKAVTINFNGTDYEYNEKAYWNFSKVRSRSMVYACRAGVCGLVCAN